MATSDVLNRARGAISGIESGGRYGITGPATRGDVPLGRYQVMASNLPSWSMAALGRQVSPQEFLSNSKLQDAVFDHRFGSYLDKYGPAGAARAWFGGEGRVRSGGHKTDILGTTVDGYEKKFMAAFGGAPADDGWEPVPGAQADDGWEPVPGAQAAASDEGWEPVPAAASPAVTPAAGPTAPVGPEGIALADVPGRAAQNIGSNAREMWQGAKALGSQIIDDPVGLAKQVGQGMYQAGVENVVPVAREVLKATGNEGSVPQLEGWAGRQGAKVAPDQPIDFVRDIKKSYEGLKKQVAEQPLKTGMDAATFGVPGAGGVGRAALGTVTGAVNLADRALAPTLGRALTGVSGGLQREATAAGIAGGAQGAAFRGQLRGTASPDVPVQLAREAEDAIHQRGLADRDATLAGGANQTVFNPHASPTRIQSALDDARQGNRDVAGIVQNREIEGMLDTLQGHIDETFPGGRPLNPAAGSVAGVDALKRRIGDTLAAAGAFKSGGTAGRLGGQVYNAVKQAITDAYPDYAPGMARAETGIKELQQVQRQLSLRSQNSATTGGALQSAARNDAHGAYGMRRQSLDILRRERPELVSALAGQALGSMSPRGIAPWMMLAGHGMTGSIPTALAHYIASIPRLHGEARYALGSTIRAARRARLTQRNAGNLLDALRLAPREEEETK